MKLKTILITLVIISLSVLIIYRINSNSKANNNSAKKGGGAPISVEGIVAQTQIFSDQLALTGTLEANEQLEVRSEISGVVEKIYFQEGSSVNKGQALLKVNDIELRAQLAQAKTKQELASENERRAKFLLQKEAISQEEYDIASADYKSAKAQIQLIQAQLSKTTVVAPFSGKIGLRSISLGAYITPTTLVAKLINLQQIKITFSIPEKYATQIKTGTEVNFTVAGQKETFTAKVYALEPEIETATRTLKVRAIAQNLQGKLIPGTFASVNFPLDQIKDAILVPSEAIVPIQDGKKIFISEKGKAKGIEVIAGARTNKDVLILSGVKPGDTVLTTGVMSLKDGTPLKVIVK
jgi:membrane fusion protein (multidrug efflux system)